MRGAGVEPARLAAQDPKSCVSANSTTHAGRHIISNTLSKSKEFRAESNNAY